MLKFRPLQDRLLVVRIDAEETTRGGIVIPDTAKERPQEGRVVAVGPGRRLEDGSVRPLEAKPGDRILFGRYAGTEIQLEGEEHLILREEDVLAVLD